MTTADEPTPPEEAQPEKPAKARSGVGGILREATIVIVGALIASTLLRLFLLQVFQIPSRSMESTLEVGDRVAVQKVVPFKRGDVVVFRDDLEWLGPPDAGERTVVQDVLVFIGLMPDESQSHLVKRVIGLPGDRVICCDTSGRLTVNGVALDEASYLYKDETTGQTVAPSEVTFDITVPEGRIFVMGDHRDMSYDSRCHLQEDVNGVRGAGAFPARSSVVGAGLARIYPFDRWGGFSTPATFAAIPDGGTPPAQPVLVGPVPHCG